MKSIFDLENRLDITREAEKLIKAFFEDRDAVDYKVSDDYPWVRGTLIEAIERIVFIKWKYRDTFLDVEEYLEHIGIDYERVILYGYYSIEKEVFLHLLEFLANMIWLVDKEKSIELSNKAKAYIENIPRILEKMNYTLQELEDRVIIIKRDADVDSVLNIVPKNISNLLLEYNDFRIRNNIKAKKEILKNIDLYLDHDNSKIKKQIKSLNLNTIEIFETIVNNMGVNHDGKDEIYKTMSDEEKIVWYDKAFLAILHGIRSIEVNKIKKERDKLVKKNNEGF